MESSRKKDPEREGQLSVGNALKENKRQELQTLMVNKK